MTSVMYVRATMNLIDDIGDFPILLHVRNEEDLLRFIAEVSTNTPISDVKWRKTKEGESID